jgi:hypothetical protein
LQATDLRTGGLEFRKQACHWVNERFGMSLERENFRYTAIRNGGDLIVSAFTGAWRGQKHLKLNQKPT